MQDFLIRGYLSTKTYSINSTTRVGVFALVKPSGGGGGSTFRPILIFM